MKARNIIPGWPRSRSTLPSFRNRWDDVLFRFWFGEDDFMANFRYHQQQQEMNARYFADYRLPPDDRWPDLGIKS